jgi:predicted metal-dependent hydrolase
METIVTGFTVGVIILMSQMAYENKIADVTYVKSSVDMNKYLVRNEPDKIKAANLLAKIRVNIVKLINYLTQKYPENKVVRRIKSKFDPNNFTETANNSKYTSYSVNKGEKIVLCLRSRDSHNKLIDINTIMFVTLHEIAHIGTLSIGHTTEFWDNFRFLLKESIAINIYKWQDFNTHPKKYCGIKITDQPLNKSNI